jgi:hypothetical protein
MCYVCLITDYVYYANKCWWIKKNRNEIYFCVSKISFFDLMNYFLLTPQKLYILVSWLFTFKALHIFKEYFFPILSFTLKDQTNELFTYIHVCQFEHFIFNCGEGKQLFCNTNWISISRVLKKLMRKICWRAHRNEIFSYNHKMRFIYQLFSLFHPVDILLSITSFFPLFCIFPFASGKKRSFVLFDKLYKVINLILIWIENAT